MVRSAGELIDCIKNAVLNFGADQDTRIICRVGDFGPEHVLEHVKVRGGRKGLEVIIQIAETPNLQ